MEIAFRTKYLRDLCESEQKATRFLGQTLAGKLKRRLADLRAAETLADAGSVVTFREVGRARPRHMALNLSTGSTMTFRANHSTVPRLEGGEMDHANVTRIKILSITNSR